MKTQALLLYSLVLLSQSTDLDDDGSGKELFETDSNASTTTEALSTKMSTLLTSSNTQNDSRTTIITSSAAPITSINNVTFNVTRTQMTQSSQDKSFSSTILSTSQILNSTSKSLLSTIPITQVQSSPHLTRHTKQDSKKVTTSKLSTFPSSTNIATSKQKYSTFKKPSLNTTSSKITKHSKLENIQTFHESIELITIDNTEQDLTSSKHLSQPITYKPTHQSIIDVPRSWVYPLIGIVAIVVLLIIMSSMYCYLHRFDEKFE
uniref:Glycoprotein n=1 Tax=Saimiriine herpesvirus 2 TaxID=10381 RepID=Q80BJ1_SHV2|nr:glycoprotein [Saimiriine gammaherpesvirus 2]